MGYFCKISKRLLQKSFIFDNWQGPENGSGLLKSRKNSFRVNLVNCIKCPYLELFWSVFFRIRTEFGDIRSISPYSVWMRENTEQNNSEYRRFLRSGYKLDSPMKEFWVYKRYLEPCQASMMKLCLKNC